MSSKGKENSKSSSLFSQTYTEQFEKMFPFYLLCGMTAEQYWDGDNTLTKYYRKAHELKQEEINSQLWLQGRYVYDALCRIAPILRPFSKAKKPMEYPEEPYLLNTSFKKDRKAELEEKSDKKAKEMMEAFATAFNKRFLEKGGVKNG